MKTIWKWTLQPETTIEMPHGAKLLAVQEQRGEPQLWALVDPGAKKYPRTFRVYGTGHDLPDKPGQYVGTFQMRGGALVFHVFEANSPLCVCATCGHEWDDANRPHCIACGTPYRAPPRQQCGSAIGAEVDCET